MNEITLIFNGKNYVCNSFENLSKSKYFANQYMYLGKPKILEMPQDLLYCTNIMFGNIVTYLNGTPMNDSLSYPSVLNRTPRNDSLSYLNLFPFENYIQYYHLVDFLCINDLLEILIKNIKLLIKKPYLFTPHKNLIDDFININGGIDILTANNNELNFLRKYIKNDDIDYDKIKYDYFFSKSTYIKLYSLNYKYKYLSTPDNIINHMTIDGYCRHVRNDNIFVTKEVFEENLSKYSNNLIKYIPFDYNNIIFSGGTLFDILTDNQNNLNKCVDLDFFVLKTEKLIDIVERIVKNLVSDNLKVVICYKEIIIYIFVVDVNKIIQIIPTKYETFEDIIDNFDSSHAKSYYDGKNLYTSHDCVHGLMYGYSHLYESRNIRLYKILDRNLNVSNHIKNASITQLHYFSNVNLIIRGISYNDLLNDKAIIKYNETINYNLSGYFKILKYIDKYIGSLCIADNNYFGVDYYLSKKRFSFRKFIKMYTQCCKYANIKDYAIDFYQYLHADDAKQIDLDNIDYSQLETEWFLTTFKKTKTENHTRYNLMPGHIVNIWGEKTSEYINTEHWSPQYGDILNEKYSGITQNSKVLVLKTYYIKKILKKFNYLIGRFEKYLAQTGIIDSNKLVKTEKKFIIENDETDTHYVLNLYCYAYQPYEILQILNYYGPYISYYFDAYVKINFNTVTIKYYLNIAP